MLPTLAVPVIVGVGVRVRERFGAGVAVSVGTGVGKRVGAGVGLGVEVIGSKPKKLLVIVADLKPVLDPVTWTLILVEPVPGVFG